jgi:hypothetical protein
MTRRFLPVALALAAAIPLAPARAQIRPGLHFARAADSFDGVNGVGGNLALRLRGFPVDLFLAGEYSSRTATTARPGEALRTST